MTTDLRPRSEQNTASLGYARPGTYRRSIWTLQFKIAIFIACVSLGAGVLWVLTPALSRSPETAGRVKCAANLRAIANAMLLYANDNNGNYPDNLAVLIGLKYDFTQHSLLCSRSPDQMLSDDGLLADVQKIYQRGRPEDFAMTRSRPMLHISYVYAGKGLTLQAPPNVILAYEMLSNHADDGVNALFGDGHVDWLSKTEAVHMINEIQTGHNPPR